MNQPIADPSVLAEAERFEIGAEIGSGAIATVTRIVERASGHVYAGKFLHPRHQRDEAALGRFRREAELASRLRQQNLVAVHGIFEIHGRPALVMELVEGPTLAAYLARRGFALPEPELVRIAHGIASGLAYAHGSGVIHRDLKPANVLLAHDDGGPVPKIADFGMARAASFANADRRALTVLGTPPYMAPECLEPLAVDARADLYALGCIIHEMANGAPPYGGATPFAVLEAHRTAAIPRLPDAYSQPLAELTARLLAKLPGDRPQSATAVVDALAAMLSPHVQGGSAIAVRSTSTRALAIDDAALGRCAGCGARVMPELRICFACGVVQARLEAGSHTVFVTGPGQWSHKLDSERRERLLTWVEANAVVGFDATPLRRRIPRLPFAFVVGVSEASAGTLVASLQRLGIHAEALRGTAMTHAGVRRTALRLAGRRLTLIGAIGAMPAMVHPFMLVVVPFVVGIAGPVCFATAAIEASRPALTVRGKTGGSELPPQLRARIDGLYAAIDGIGERRHREALRAVVNRTISLTRALPQASRLEIDGEMAHAVNLAAVATRRMDELDREMSRPDFDPSDAYHRSLMHERDMWSSRLLDLTATLDALAARRALAAARIEDVGAAAEFAELRHHVESLEEVRRL